MAERKIKLIPMFCRVTEVIDGDTFKVSPNWIWGGNSGDTIRAAGYNSPEKGKPGYEHAKAKLKGLVEGGMVTIRGISFTYGRLLADVYVGTKNLADYFPEYK